MSKRTDYVFTAICANGERSNIRPVFDMDAIFSTVPNDVKDECARCTRYLLDVANEYCWYEKTIDVSALYLEAFWNNMAASEAARKRA